MEHTPIAVRLAERGALLAPAGALLAASIALVSLGIRWDERSDAAMMNVVMVPATATGILLASFALLAMRFSRGDAAKMLGRVAALATAAIGLITFAQYAFDWNVGANGSGPFIPDGHW